MERIKRASTSKTPEVLFDADLGVLELSGRSISEYPGDFYQEILEGIDQYFEEHDITLKVSIKLDYFNTASLKEIYTMLKKLDGKKAKVFWYHEEDDDDMEETAEHLKSMVSDLYFELIPIYD